MSAPVTLCFLLRNHNDEQQVLLGVKKTGMGVGKVVGIGGHVEVGESVVQAICREVEEETSIVIAAMDLIPAGTVEFIFPAKPVWDMFTTIFLCRKYTGSAIESDEIKPHWYSVHDLPHAHMWADASHWLPAFLAGERGHWRVVLNDDNETVSQSTHMLKPADADGSLRGS